MKARLIVFGFALAAIITAWVGSHRREVVRRESEPTSDAMEALDAWAAQRAYPERTIPDAGFFAAYERRGETAGRDDRRLPAADSWKSIGPSNRGGRTIALCVDPKDPNTIYAGSASGGLWRLKMRGQSYSWKYIETGFPVLGVNSIAVDPADSKILYIGTGEVYGYQSAFGGLYIRTTRGSYGLGILKSINGGKTWTKSLDWTYGQRRGVLALRINPRSSNLVFAGTTEGVYKSVDAGSTWRKVLSVIMAVDLAIDPQTPSVVYASCGNMGGGGPGIYQSTKSGEPGTWTRLGGGLPQTWTGKTLLAIYKSSPNVIFADVADAFISRGLFRSDNRGETWTRLTSLDYASYQGWYSHYVRVDPQNSSKLFCAGVEFYVSNDGGRTFARKREMHVDHHAYAEHPSDPNIVYFANDGGVYRTTDGGNTFEDLSNGLVTAQFYNGFSSSPTDPGLALGGLQDNSTVKYVGSKEWVIDLIGGDGAYTAINPNDANVVYGSWQYLNILRSTNRGVDWDDLSTPFSHENTCFVAPFLLSPADPRTLYAAEDKVYVSRDAGDNWSVLNGGRPLNGNPVLSMAVSASDVSVVYAATVPASGSTAEVFATRDGGTSWTNITKNLPDRYFVDLQVSPVNDRKTYVTLGGFGSSHVYRSADGGSTWTDIGKSLPDLPTSALVIDPLNENHIYVGNDQGVYVSLDGGSTWQSFSQGLHTAVIVMDLSISKSNRRIRAVTHGSGVYERPLL